MKGFKRKPIVEKIIFGLTLLGATAGVLDARNLTRGTSQFINAWSPIALDLFVLAQLIAGVLFLVFGLFGVRMRRLMFTACGLTTAFFVFASTAYVFSVPGTSKAGLAYAWGFLLLMLWQAINRPARNK